MSPRTELTALSRFSTAPAATPPPFAFATFAPSRDPSLADDLSALEATATEAAEKQIIAPTPDARAAFEASPEHIAATRKILHLLGYLAQNTADPTLTPELREAIKLFQTEAGLTIDGWVGPETWRVVENLYNFETDADIPRWTASPAHEKLLHRATQRRLNALGLEPTLPHTALVDLTPALTRFQTLAEELRLFPSSPTARPNEPALDLRPSDLRLLTLQCLFDHDTMIARLGTHETGIPFQDRDRRKRLGPFLVNLLKIELWLLHYDVIPDGDGSYDLSALTATHFGRRGILKPTTPLPAAYLALREFWQDHLKTSRTDPAAFLDPGQFLSNYPSFFREFAALTASGQTSLHDDALAQRIATEIETNPNAYEKTWFDRARQLGGILWDGVKRAFGWLRRFFDTVIDKVQNLVRAAHHLAAETFAALRCAIATFPAAVDLLFARTAPGSDSRSIIYTHDRDSDYTNWLNPLVTKETLHTCATTLRRHTTALGFSTRILGLILEGLRAAISAGLTNWLALVRTLLRLRGTLADTITYWREHRLQLLSLIASEIPN